MWSKGHVIILVIRLIGFLRKRYNTIKWAYHPYCHDFLDLFSFFSPPPVTRNFYVGGEWKIRVSIYQVLLKLRCVEGGIKYTLLIILISLVTLCKLLKECFKLSANVEIIDLMHMKLIKYHDSSFIIKLQM